MAESFHTFVCEPKRCAKEAAEASLLDLTKALPDGAQTTSRGVVFIAAAGTGPCVRSHGGCRNECRAAYKARVEYTPAPTS